MASGQSSSSLISFLYSFILLLSLFVFFSPSSSVLVSCGTTAGGHIDNLCYNGFLCTPTSNLTFHWCCTAGTDYVCNYASSADNYQKSNAPNDCADFTQCGCYKPSPGLSNGAIVGIVLGATFGGIILFILFVFCCAFYYDKCCGDHYEHPLFCSLCDCLGAFWCHWLCCDCDDYGNRCSDVCYCGIFRMCCCCGKCDCDCDCLDCSNIDWRCCCFCPQKKEDVTTHTVYAPATAASIAIELGKTTTDTTTTGTTTGTSAYTLKTENNTKAKKSYENDLSLSSVSTSIKKPPTYGDDNDTNSNANKNTNHNDIAVVVGSSHTTADSSSSSTGMALVSSSNPSCPSCSSNDVIKTDQTSKRYSCNQCGKEFHL